MKNILSLVIITSLCLVFQSHTPPQKPINKFQKAFLSFVWYHDPDYLDPTGTNCSTADEIDRLRETFPNYIFRDTPGFGLLPIEWGYYSPTIKAIIYSDLY